MSKALDELREIHRQALADGMVKVGLPADMGPVETEWCFAERISATRARLVNVPVLNPDVNYGDVVEYREQSPRHELFKEFVQVVVPGSFKLPACFIADEEQLSLEQERQRMRMVSERLRSAPEASRPVRWEGVGGGWVVIAWPLSVTEEQAVDVLRSIPGWQGEG